MIRSLWLLVRRRIDGQTVGVTPFGYTRGTLWMPLAFLAASLIEALVIHLVVPWHWVRVGLLVATVVSLVPIGGWIAGRIVHPHLVSASGIVLRSGPGFQVEIDRSVITRVSVSRRYSETADVVVDDYLYLPGPDGTVVDIEFERLMPVSLPKRISQECRAVRGVRLYVDDADEFVAALSFSQELG